MSTGQEVIIAGFSLGAVILVLIQVIKVAFPIPSRYIPLLSIVFGAVISTIFGVLSQKAGMALFEFFIAGIMAGQMATGTYSGAQNWKNSKDNAI